MRDIFSDLLAWLGEGQRIALATVVETWGSAPRRVGSKMGITSDGRVSGSVSGGCVENAVIEAAAEVLQSDHAKLLHFGVSDESAWDVGLSCGGNIDVFVQALEPRILDEVQQLNRDDGPGALVTIIRGPDNFLGKTTLLKAQAVSRAFAEAWDDRAIALVNEATRDGESRRAQVTDEIEVFIEVIEPAPTLIMVGAVHIAVALTSIAGTLGFRTVLIDPRKTWANEERFPRLDRLIQTWPPEAFTELSMTNSTAIAMLTHDPKLDDPSCMLALRSSAFYIGALGSRKTNEKRRQRLLAAGFSESELSRLHAPIGLNIAADTPEEIALSIMAEIVAARRKRPQPVYEVNR